MEVLKKLLQLSRLKNDPREQEIVKYVDMNVCTFKLTQKDHCYQRFYNCGQCNLIGNSGICVTCAQTCHKGHKGLVESQLSPCGFFCDCGADNRCCKGMKNEMPEGYIPPSKPQISTYRSRSKKMGALADEAMMLRYELSDSFRKKMGPNTLFINELLNDAFHEKDIEDGNDRFRDEIFHNFSGEYRCKIYRYRKLLSVRPDFVKKMLHTNKVDSRFTVKDQISFICFGFNHVLSHLDSKTSKKYIDKLSTLTESLDETGTIHEAFGKSLMSMFLHDKFGHRNEAVKYLLEAIRIVRKLYPNFPGSMKLTELNDMPRMNVFAVCYIYYAYYCIYKIRVGGMYDFIEVAKSNKSFLRIIKFSKKMLLSLHKIVKSPYFDHVEEGYPHFYNDMNEKIVNFTQTISRCYFYAGQPDEALRYIDMAIKHLRYWMKTTDTSGDADVLCQAISKPGLRLARLKLTKCQVLFERSSSEKHKFVSELKHVKKHVDELSTMDRQCYEELMMFYYAKSGNRAKKIVHLENAIEMSMKCTGLYDDRTIYLMIQRTLLYIEDGYLTEAKKYMKRIKRRNDLRPSWKQLLKEMKNAMKKKKKMERFEEFKEKANRLGWNPSIVEKERRIKKIVVCSNVYCCRSTGGGGKCDDIFEQNPFLEDGIKVKPKSCCESFKVCSGCKTASYCSKECQKVDWKERHRQRCSRKFVKKRRR